VRDIYVRSNRYGGSVVYEAPAIYRGIVADTAFADVKKTDVTVNSGPAPNASHKDGEKKSSSWEEK